MSGRTVDPVTLTVIWNSLISIAEELGVTLRHTAFSEGVREGDDFATALFDRNGVMLGQGNFSPGHLGSMPAMAKHVLGYFPVDKLKSQTLDPMSMTPDQFAKRLRSDYEKYEKVIKLTGAKID